MKFLVAELLGRGAQRVFRWGEDHNACPFAMTISRHVGGRLARWSFCLDQ